MLGVCEPTFSSWGFGGRRKPPRQTHFGNNLLKSGLKQVSGSPSTPPKSWYTKRLVFVRSYITKRKIGHSFRRLGYPPSEGPKLVIITHPLPRDYGATASWVQMSHFPPKQIIEHSNKNTKQKFKNIQHYFQFDIV